MIEIEQMKTKLKDGSKNIMIRLKKPEPVVRVSELKVEREAIHDLKYFVLSPDKFTEKDRIVLHNEIDRIVERFDKCFEEVKK